MPKIKDGQHLWDFQRQVFILTGLLLSEASGRQMPCTTVFLQGLLSDTQVAVMTDVSRQNKNNTPVCIGVFQIVN